MTRSNAAPPPGEPAPVPSDPGDPPPRRLAAAIVYGTGDDTGTADTEAADTPEDAQARPTPAWTVDAWKPTDGPASAVADLPPPERAVEAAVGAVGEWPGLIDRLSEVTIVLAEDGEVAELNARYRGQAKPTNVLSFPASPRLRHDSEDEWIPRAALGDIILAGETVLREAAELGIPPAHHLQHLVVHGLLHLLGHDHDTDDRAERMESLEVEILKTLGVADPYADSVPFDAREAGGD